MHFLKSAHLRALLGQTRWPGNFEWLFDWFSITISKEHRQQDRRTNIRKVGGHEELEKSMDSIKVMALVAQLAPVSICERYLDLGEERTWRKALRRFSGTSGA